MGDRDFVELVAGRALDDLDPHEQARLEPHLAVCRPCRDAAWDLDETIADLALAAPYRVPPAALHNSVMKALDARPLTLVSSPAATSREAAPRGGRLRWRWEGIRPLLPLGLAAVIAVAAIGTLGYQTIQLRGQLNDASAQVGSLQDQLGDQSGMLAVAMNPTHRLAVLKPEALAPNAAASVVFVPGTDRSYLVADQLPSTAPGTVYQLWYADAAGVHAGRTFTWSGHGTVVQPFGVDLSGKAAAMVTLESTGGATGSPGPQVVFGTIPTA